MKKILCLLSLAMFCAAPVWAQNAVGKASMVVGVAYAKDATGAQRRLGRGDSIYAGDVVATLRHSYVNVRYSDQGRTLIGPNSEMKIEEYSYSAPNNGGARSKQGPSSASSEVGRSIFSLIKGSLRAVTGLIGKRDRSAYSLRTAAATIGVRGTDYFVIICDDQCTDLPAGIVPEGGVIVGVHEGGVTLTNGSLDNFDVNVDRFVFVTAGGEFVPLPGMPPQLLLTPLENPEVCN